MIIGLTGGIASGKYRRRYPLSLAPSLLMLTNSTPVYELTRLTRGGGRRIRRRHPG